MLQTTNYSIWADADNNVYSSIYLILNALRYLEYRQVANSLHIQHRCDTLLNNENLCSFICYHKKRQEHSKPRVFDVISFYFELIVLFLFPNIPLHLFDSDFGRVKE